MNMRKKIRHWLCRLAYRADCYAFDPFAMVDHRWYWPIMDKVSKGLTWLAGKVDGDLGENWNARCLMAGRSYSAGDPVATHGHDEDFSEEEHDRTAYVHEQEQDEGWSK